MSRFFNQDNLFFKIMGTFFDLIVLNLLTLLMCLPIVTAGASLTAMHYMLWHMVRGEETYISRQFFDSFKRNFKQATLIWLVFLVVGIIMAVDVMVLLALPREQQWMMGAVVAIVGCVVVVMAQYVFPLLSRYEDPIRVQVKNAAMLAVGYFPRTLAMLVVLGAFAVAYVHYFAYAIPGIILLGITLPQYCCAWLYNTVFRKLDGEDVRGGQASHG